MYPDVVEITPGTLSKSASVHQKHPPAKIAVAVLGACTTEPVVAAASRQAAAINRPIMSRTSQVVLCSGAMYSRSARKARSIALTIARNRGDPCRPLRQCPRVRRNLEPAYAL